MVEENENEQNKDEKNIRGTTRAFDNSEIQEIKKASEQSQPAVKNFPKTIAMSNEEINAIVRDSKRSTDKKTKSEVEEKTEDKES